MTDKEPFAIVVISYNRVHSLNRLLNSLNNADYEEDCVPLIISIDKSGKDDVYNFAQNFIWKHGKKIIRTFQERQGLRNHILLCGSYTEQYNSIVVFEDDIYVCSNFYKYSKQAIEFYKDDNNIAGISLYSFEKNYNNGLPFNALRSEYDNFFINIAQSWGQIWICEKWNKFIDWYNVNSEDFIQQNHLPTNICNWPTTSWLKYHTKYCIETNRYFVYPYKSLCTNFGDGGTHNIHSNSNWQVSMQYGTKNIYNFSPFNNKAIIYDAFFEHQYLGTYCNVNDSDLCVDLYGDKNNREKKRYWLTLRKNNFKIIKSYALALRPHETNIIQNILGTDIFLYDTSISEKFTKKSKYPVNEFTYNVRMINKRFVLHFFKTIKYLLINKNVRHE